MSPTSVIATTAWAWGSAWLEAGISSVGLLKARQDLLWLWPLAHGCAESIGSFRLLGPPASPAAQSEALPRPDYHRTAVNH